MFLLKALVTLQSLVSSSIMTKYNKAIEVSLTKQTALLEKRDKQLTAIEVVSAIEAKRIKLLIKSNEDKTMLTVMKAQSTYSDNMTKASAELHKIHQIMGHTDD